MSRISLPISVAIVLFVAGCGSIHNLAPSTAAARISSYDGYKEEACAVMQDYVSILTAMTWSAPRPVALKPAAEVEHFTQVFAENPEVTCRVKAGKNLFDLTGRKFHQILLHIKPLQVAYASILENGTDRCSDCLLPNYPISNSLLAEYYRQPPFPSFRAKHIEQFQDMCLDADNLEESEPLIQIHDNHIWPPSIMNPLYPSHSGCQDIWKSALQAQASRCARYEDIPRYLVCPDVIWDTRSVPARPLGYPKRYTRNTPFAAGFVLTVSGGYDVYWQSSPGILSHEFIRHKADEPAKFADFDVNNRNDFSAGGLLFLAQKDGTAIRKTVVDFNRQADRNVSDSRAHQAAALQGQWLEKMSLFEVEELLSASQINNPFLLKRAAALSGSWWQDSGEVAKSLREMMRIYWHAALWSRVTGAEPPDAEFLDEAIASLRTDSMSERLAAISQAYTRGARGTIAAECDLLQGEIREGTRIAEEMGEGTDLAQEEIGPAWRVYLKVEIPLGKMRTAKSNFTTATDRMAPEIKTLCKKD